MIGSPSSLTEINCFSADGVTTLFPAAYIKKRRIETMKMNTLIVLEKGNDCAFDGPLSACCFASFMPLM